MHKFKKFKFTFFAIIMVILLTFILVDGTFTQKRYLEVWDSHISNKYDNVQKKILSQALRASSSHNMQPWKVEIVNDTTIKLYADVSKTLHVIDPSRVQWYMSQGTFIEKYVTIAKQYGYKTHVVYAEMSKDRLQEDNLHYVATLTIEKAFDDLASNPDSVSSASMGTDIIEVNSNKQQVLETALESVENSYEALSVELIYTAQDTQIQAYLKEAYRIESTNEAAMKELIENYRFTEYEKNMYRYGLSLNETSVYLRPVIQPIMKWSSGNWEQFGKAGINTFNSRLNSEFAYVIVKAKNPTWKTYVDAGGFYEKLATKSTGYTLRPAVQILEDFNEMDALKSAFHKVYGREEDILIIIGVQPSRGGTTPALRHTVEDILLQTP